MHVPRKAIGAKIREFRAALGLTQAELAERGELDTVYISQVERGQKVLSLPALYRIAEALNVKPGKLLDPEDTPDEDPLILEIRDVLKHWNDNQRQALLRALRALAEL